MLDPELHAPRRVYFNDVDKVPGNAVRGELARKRFKGGTRQHAFEDAAKRAAHAHFHFRHAQKVRGAVAHPLQIDVVDANHFSPVDVDDLAVDQVLLQVEIVALVLQGNHGTRRAEFQRSGGSLHHVLRGDDEKTVTRLQHQACNLARIRPRVHGYVFQPPAQVALRIRNRGAQQRRKAYAGCGARMHDESLFPACGLWPVAHLLSQPGGGSNRWQPFLNLDNLMRRQ